MAENQEELQEYKELLNYLLKKSNLHKVESVFARMTFVNIKEVLDKYSNKSNDDIPEDIDFNKYPNLILEELKNRRKSLNLKQEDCAEQLNVSRTVYGSYERGLRNIPLKHYKKLSSFCDLSNDTLVNNFKEVICELIKKLNDYQLLTIYHKIKLIVTGQDEEN